jgi:hypothetical protein
MTEDITPETANQARSLFGDLIEGRWEKARQEFDPGLRERANADLIARGWAHVASSGGSFERMGSPSARRSGGYTVVAVPLTFRSGDAIGRVVLDHDGKVTGLALEYPRRHRLDPRRVHVFGAGNGNPKVARALHVPL